MDSQNNSSPNQEKVLEHILGTILFKFQREWVLDRSRFKICRKARQIGISLCIGLEGLLDVLQNQPVYFVSRTERQSVYLLDKFYRWCDYFIRAGVPLSFSDRSRTECKVNGVDVKSLTSNAVGDEGYSGNVYLDEFGLHENDEQIYRSLLPTISWGFKIRIVSRPFGQSNKFYQIFTDEGAYTDYKRYTFDIHRAVRDGLPVDVDAIKRNFDDEGFRENYLCEFIDESVAFLPYPLLRSCVGDAPEGSGPSYIGVDIGRRHDRTTLVVLTLLGDRLYTRRMEELKNQTFEVQRETIRQVIGECKILRGCVDATGLGMQLAEELQSEFGFIEPVTFTNPAKEEIAVLTKRKFEAKEIQIPDDMKLISDCHAIKKTVTPSNNVRFDADRTSEGHADRFWALGLAIRAASDTSDFKVLFAA